MVLLGEMRQCVRIRFTFTRPYFGTASSRSKTLAVSRYSGGSSSSPWICSAARLEVPLQPCAPGPDLVRPLESVHPLGERALGSEARRVSLGGRLGGGRHGRR